LSEITRLTPVLHQKLYFQLQFQSKITFSTPNSLKSQQKLAGTMIGVIGLGTPMQPTTMELNPTTPDFFVVASNCKTPGCTQNRKGFDTDKSSTFSDNGRKVPFATR
jgi:hypothetical protein